jgi:hypothetical protein
MIFELFFLLFGLVFGNSIEYCVYSGLVNQNVTLRPHKSAYIHEIKWRFQNDGSNNDQELSYNYRVIRNKLQIPALSFNDALKTFIYSKVNSTSVDFQNYDPLGGIKFVIFDNKVDCSTFNNHLKQSPIKSNIDASPGNNISLYCSIKVKKSSKLSFKPLFTWFQNELNINGSINNIEITNISSEIVEKSLGDDFYLYTQKINYNIPNDNLKAWKLNDQMLTCQIGHNNFYIDEDAFNVRKIKDLTCNFNLTIYHKPFIISNLANRTQFLTSNKVDGVFIECPVKIHLKDYKNYQIKWSFLSTSSKWETIITDNFIKTEFLTAKTLPNGHCLKQGLYRCEIVDKRLSLSSKIEVNFENESQITSNVPINEIIDEILEPEISYFIQIGLIILFLILDIIFYQLNKRFFKKNDSNANNNNNLNANNNNSTSITNIQLKPIGVHFAKHKKDCPLYRQDPLRFIPTLEIDDED